MHGSWWRYALYSVLILAEFTFSQKISVAYYLTFINDWLIDGFTVHIIWSCWQCVFSFCRSYVNVNLFDDYRDWELCVDDLHAWPDPFYHSFLQQVIIVFFIAHFSSEFVSMPRRTGLVSAFEEPERALIICTGLCVLWWARQGRARPAVAWTKRPCSVRSWLVCVCVCACVCVCVCVCTDNYTCVVAALCFPAQGLAGQNSSLTNMDV